MGQVTGIVKIKVNGNLQRSKDGAKLNIGGKEREAVTGLVERVAKMLKQLKSAAPGARSIAKKLAGDIAGRPIDEALMTETAQLIADVRAMPEAREGLTAFLEKRKPSWS